MAMFNSLIGSVVGFDNALNEKQEESEEEEEEYKPKWSLEELEAQYAAQAKKTKKKKKKKAPPPPKVEEKPKPKPKPKPKKDTIENLKKYLAKEEDKEKIDYDAIIRPSEPIRNFQDIAKRTAALALLEKKESNDSNGAEDDDDPDLAAAKKRGPQEEDPDSDAELAKTKSSWSLLAGHFKAKTLFEATRPEDEEEGGEEKAKKSDVVDLPPGDSTEDLMWLRKWLDKEDERQDNRVKKLAEMTEEGDEALPPLTFQMTKEAQAKEMQELVNQIKERQAKDPTYKRKTAPKTSLPTQAPLSKQEMKLAALAGKSTMACSHGGMCIHMIRALAIMEAKEAQAKEKVSTRWT